jgi:hypothetical protein
MTGLKAPLSLLDRFLVRLSTVICVEMKLSMHGSQQSIKIYLSRTSRSAKGCRGLDDELQQFHRKMERSMICIAIHRSGASAIKCPNALLTVTGFRCKEAEDNLEDAIEAYIFPNTDHVVESIKGHSQTTMIPLRHF